MAKPTAKSTVGQMKEYIRLKKLNKAPILLGMKRAELIAGLRKLGHWDAQHDKPSAKVPAPKKPAPKKDDEVRAGDKSARPRVDPKKLVVIKKPEAPAPAPKKRPKNKDKFEAYRVEALGMLAKIRDRMSPNHIALAEKLLKNRKQLLIKGPKLTPTHFEFDSLRRVARLPFWDEHKYELIKKPEAPAFVEVDLKEFDKARADKARAPKAVPKPAPKKEAPKKAPAKDKESIRKQLKKELGKLLTRNILSNTKNYPQFGTAMHIPPRPEDKYQFFGDRVTLKDVEPKIKAIKEALSKELLDQFRVQFISGHGSNDAELLYDFKTDTIISTQDKKKKKARK